MQNSCYKDAPNEEIDYRIFSPNESSLLLSLLEADKDIDVTKKPNKTSSKKKINNYNTIEPIEQNNKKKYTEEDKRRDISEINRQFTNALKGLNILVNNAYHNWRKAVECNEPGTEAAREWELLSEQYKAAKIEAADEIFRLVQNLFARIYDFDGVDLHGQGIKSGCFEHIVLQQIEEAEDVNKTSIVFDVGDENDGDWHFLAITTLRDILQKQNLDYSEDNKGHFVTVFLEEYQNNVESWE
ncbi:hypothetical protein EIN_492680 [Entamoeba invadens IP1]|uniref:Uncharacterized protein n=1 Tax=Entamoeba invadens IP1 TaxID=370355 RepID=A0A0A1UA30_ENTIV|nr:hypothetical protein EIN_492680 [Entamoeba invadens IP1]ELP88999.1 hypothetical protein EIN_492680 [Entamoeba invadens IP1]|eukprot:XP_004255770.1 hypothetical protein EIN_492680 [Entamoeba invadens IP1]